MRNLPNRNQNNGPEEQPSIQEAGRSWQKIFAYLKPHKWVIAIVLFLSFTGSILLIAGPRQLEKITNIILDGLSTTVDMAAVGRIGVVLLIIYFFGFLFNYLKRFFMAGITQRINDVLRNGISEKINKVPLSYFDKVSYGDVLSRVTNDVATIGQTMHQSVPQLMTSATMLIGSFLMMLFTNVTMTLTVVIVTVLGFSVVQVIAKRSQPYFNAQQHELGNINGYVEEMYSAHNVVKVYNASEQTKGEFSEINEQLFQSGWKSQFLSGSLSPLMGFIGNLSYVLVCIVGAVLVLQGKIQFGVIVAFTIYVRQFNNPISQITQLISSLQSASAAADRVFEFLEEEELDDESEKTAVLTDVKGDVTFENVQFSYVPGEPIIHDFSAEVTAGQKIAIVGPTGAGKTTMVNLLMRFYEIDSGDIKIDGVSVQDMTRESVHDLFCMVLQDTWIFEGTILENIIYSEEGISVAEVVRACEQVGIDHFIRTLPMGYNTILDEKTTLSEGQKQQLTIARAIVKDAPLLILDEATSSVDTRTELIIQEAMDNLMEGRTSFVIAHRLSTIRNADVILVMRDGDIIESGNHDELLEEEGFYYELYNSQFTTMDEAS